MKDGDRRRRALFAALLGIAMGLSAHLSDRPLIAHAASRLSHAGLPPAAVATEGAPDADVDGLGDAWEQRLAELYAPIVYHSSDESNYPTSVDEYLRASTLSFFDEGCTPDLTSARLVHPSQRDLVDAAWGASCGASFEVRGDGTWSAGKHRTFFLADVAEPERRGSADTSQWVTYFHLYPNGAGGVTVQYWRFYAYNDATNDHGGDWEGLHVVLDESLSVVRVRLLDHDEIVEPPLSRLSFEGTHVRVFSEGGGHATHFRPDGIAARGCERIGRCVLDLAQPTTFVRQETWSGGEVRSVDGPRGSTGPLLNLGSKMRPMNGQLFVRYAGLWGSPGLFYSTSGYWGPAFNETGMRADGFVTAWCEGMTGEGIREECFPRSTSP